MLGFWSKLNFWTKTWLLEWCVLRDIWRDFIQKRVQNSVRFEMKGAKKNLWYLPTSFLCRNRCNDRQSEKNGGGGNLFHFCCHFYCQRDMSYFTLLLLHTFTWCCKIWRTQFLLHTDALHTSAANSKLKYKRTEKASKKVFPATPIRMMRSRIFDKRRCVNARAHAMAVVIKGCVTLL